MTSHKRVNLKNLIILTALLPFVVAQVNLQASECSAKSNKSCENFASTFLNNTKNFDQTHNKDVIFNEDFEYFKYFLNVSSSEISITCRNSIRQLEDSARKFEMTALKILDANAKISSGILSGNINQFGDFDECLSAQSDELQGKYCLVDINVNVRYEKLQHYKNLFMSYEPYQNQFDDISHIVPKTSNIRWAACMPSTCSHSDLEIAVRETINQNIGKYLTTLKIKVKEENCQIADEHFFSKWSYGTVVTIALFLFIILISIIASLYNVANRESDKRYEILSAFSLVRNFKEISSTEISQREIPILNGIRFINTILIIIGHKSMEVHFNPIANRVQMKYLYESILSIPLRGIYLYTEGFLLLSGLLTAYSLIGKLNKGEQINIKKEIASRYCRYMPSVIALILLTTFILPIIGSGPLWPVLVTSQSEICKKYSWRNLLMIHNWFAFEKMCNFNLHHVGTDFLLFICAIILIVNLHKFPKSNTMIIALIGILSTFARFYVTYTRELAIYIRFGVELNKMMESANYMYGLPPYRFTSYSIGILMGYVLRNQKSHKLSRETLRFGWILSTLCLVITLILAYINNLTYSPLYMAMFSAFAPASFCMFLAWLIYISHNDSGNVLTRILSWRYFKITTTLSFSIYLVQFGIFNYNIGRTRTAIYFDYFTVMFDFNEFALIFFMAFIMTLFIELPFERIKKIFFDTKTTSHNCTTTYVDVNENEQIKEEMKKE